MASINEKIEGDQLNVELRTELTDVALYSYTGLCAYAFGQLYGGSEYDRELIVNWITKITEHNGHGEASKETMKALACAEVQLDNADPFIESLKTDPYVIQNGPKIIVHDLMRFALQDGCYDSRLRTLVKFLSLLLKLDWQNMELYENVIVEHLQEEEHTQSEEELKEQENRKKNSKIKRYALISIAAVGGGTLLGLTGGLAAPFIAAGAGAVIGTAGAAALASTAGVAIIGSLFGVAGLGLGGYKMKKRVGGVEEFEFEPLSEGRQLHITIAISGWLTVKMPEFKTAWLGIANSKEQYVLKYESKYLLEMGKAMDYLVSIAINAATQEALKYTILSGILTAIAWPAALLSAASVIDNPWSVCTHRAANVGKQLADVLLSRQQGKRPVTLIGFSLGARVIFYCIQEMAKRKNCEGIIEDVILLGAPVTGNPKEWQPLARVVAGKIVNGYCKGDWLLKFLYRTASIQFSVAGLKAVAWNNRRMHNIDLSDVVQGHVDYMNKIDDILNVVGINTREHAERNDCNSLQSWVQIQKSSSINDRLHDSSSDQSLHSHGNTQLPSMPGCCPVSAGSDESESKSVTLNAADGADGAEVKQVQPLKERNDDRTSSITHTDCGTVDRNALTVDCKHDSNAGGETSHRKISPPIQSNNIGKRLQDVTLDQDSDTTTSTSQEDHKDVVVSQQSICPDKESQICDKSDHVESKSKGKMDLLDVTTSECHSNVSNLVTTPDSGIVCDDVKH